MRGSEISLLWFGEGFRDIFRPNWFSEGFRDIFGSVRGSEIPLVQCSVSRYLFKLGQRSRVSQVGLSLLHCSVQALHPEI